MRIARSALARGDSALAEGVREAERVLISSSVAGELLHGFRRCSHYEENRRQLEDFLARPFVGLVQVGMTTADRLGRIMAMLYVKGRPIPTNAHGWWRMQWRPAQNYSLAIIILPKLMGWSGAHFDSACES